MEGLVPQIRLLLLPVPLLGKSTLFVLLTIVMEANNDGKAKILQSLPQQERRGNLPSGTPDLVTTV